MRKHFIVKNEIVRVDLNKADFLKSVNTAVKINYTLGKKKSKLKVLIIHSNSGYKAFENRCTHGGMELKYLTDTEELRCTSFGHSRFDLNGNVRKGPASKNLKILKLSQEDQSLIIYK